MKIIWNGRGHLGDSLRVYTFQKDGRHKYASCEYASKQASIAQRPVNALAKEVRTYMIHAISYSSV